MKKGDPWPEPVFRKVKDYRRKKQVWIHHPDHFIPYAFFDGKHYKIKEKSGLFIMFKMDPKTPETDQGWVYGTVTADGKQVISAGRVVSCMRCHERAPNDRLFGPR